MRPYRARAAAATLEETAEPVRQRLAQAARARLPEGGTSAVKLITAIVRAGELDVVTRAVIDAGAGGMTVAEVRGFGQQFGHAPGAHLAAGRALLLPKLRVDVLVRDQRAETVVEAIAKSVRAGVIGDGKIWVSPVDDALRIRTGERDGRAV